MNLAMRMIEADEKEAVIGFFGLCKSFWQTKKLDQWKNDVENGRIRTPDRTCIE